MSAETTIKKGRFFCLDVMRALAALSVLFSHWLALTAPGSYPAGFPDRIVFFFDRSFMSVFWSAGGIHPGVIVFIVLSGFCNHLFVALTPEQSSQPGFWKQYFTRRIVRIWPLYGMACVLGLVSIGLILAQPSLSPGFFLSWDPGNLGFRVLAKLTFLGPFLPFCDTDLGNGPVGTVAILMVMYAFYPVTLGIFRRWRYGGIFLLAAVFQLAGIAFLFLKFPPGYVVNSFFITYMYWVTGMVAAQLWVGSPKFLNRGFLWGAVVLAFMLCEGINHLVMFKGSHIGKSLVSACGTAFVLYAAMVFEAQRQRSPAGMIRGLAWIGERSYSLFCVHLPVLVMVTLGLGAFSQTGFLMRRILPLLCVAFVTLVAYRYIEKPSHANRRQNV